MKNIKVKLIHITPPKGVLAAIGKPYRNESPSVDLVRRICVSPHTGRPHESVLEHVGFTFDVLGSSRLELQEHMRHRLASPTVESTRFSLKKIVDLNLFSPADVNDRLLEELFVQPDFSCDKLSRISSEHADNFRAVYRTVQVRSLLALADLLRGGLPNDVAKYVVCEGLRTNFTWTINLRSLLNFLELRDSQNAHFEIRHIAGLAKGEVVSTWVGELLGQRFPAPAEDTQLKLF